MITASNSEEIPMARLAASSKLQDSYADALPASRALYERARRLFPDAVTHDNRRMQPFPLYIARADGAYKWDVDGNRYVDYWMGDGADREGTDTCRGRISPERTEDRRARPSRGPEASDVPCRDPAGCLDGGAGTARFALEPPALVKARTALAT